jgi:hypothetical protein
MKVKDLIDKLTALNPEMRIDVCGPVVDGKNCYPIKKVEIGRSLEGGPMAILVLGKYE